MPGLDVLADPGIRHFLVFASFSEPFPFIGIFALLAFLSPLSMGVLVAWITVLGSYIPGCCSSGLRFLEFNLRF